MAVQSVGYSPLTCLIWDNEYIYWHIGPFIRYYAVFACLINFALRMFSDILTWSALHHSTILWFQEILEKLLCCIYWFSSSPLRSSVMWLTRDDLTITTSSRKVDHVKQNSEQTRGSVFLFKLLNSGFSWYKNSYFCLDSTIGLESVTLGGWPNSTTSLFRIRLKKHRLHTYSYVSTTGLGCLNSTGFCQTSQWLCMHAAQSCVYYHTTIGFIGHMASCATL